jgi:hypothetical protein
VGTAMVPIGGVPLAAASTGRNRRRARLGWLGLVWRNCDVIGGGGTIRRYRSAIDRGDTIGCGHDVAGRGNATGVTACTSGDGAGGYVVERVCDGVDGGGHSGGVFSGHDDGEGLRVCANHPATTGGAVPEEALSKEGSASLGVGAGPSQALVQAGGDLHTQGGP